MERREVQTERKRLKIENESREKDGGEECAGNCKKGKEKRGFGALIVIGNKWFLKEKKCCERCLPGDGLVIRIEVRTKGREVGWRERERRRESVNIIPQP